MIESNIDVVIANLRKRAQAARDLSVPLTQAGQSVRDSIVQRFTSNDWAPNSPYTVAQKGSSRPGIDTGALRNSITSNVSGNSAEVGTNLRYAKWFNDGTGIFAGHSEWSISPRAKKALAFKGPGGEMYFARKIIMRGQPARKLVYVDDAERARVAEIFRRWFLSLQDAA